MVLHESILRLSVLDLHLDEILLDRVKSRRGLHKLSSSENIVCNEQNRMAKGNIENESKIVKF